MKVIINAPQMGESVSEATVARVMAQTGVKVSVDDEILELETDKANQVIYAPAAGMLHLDVGEGDTVVAEQVIGYIDAEEKAERVRHGKEDFVKDLAAKESPPAKEEAAPPPKEKAPEGRETRHKMSKIRQVIAKRLVEAQSQTAMLTTFNEIDMSSVINLRSHYRDSFLKEHGVRLGFMSFFVKACTSALEAFPGINSYIDGDEIVERHYYDIGIAVGTERGLIVPVVRDCDKLDFAGIEKAIADYAERGRRGQLSVDELRGGGFTITNGGVYGSLLSTPILNLPQCGILGMHKIEKRPVVVDDQIVIRPMMYVALSYDHRIVDGQTAVGFLVHIKENLEDPSRLLLHL